MCYICGRSACMPSFHSLEEQSYFGPAEEAYEKYLEILEQCREDYRNSNQEEDNP